ncbi:MAG: heparan-alpha-glucosaminide N-acetyltransferase domain-containing protein [Gloeomargarita sp. SKYG116]|nr:heparan-alpha-glucosaminide N-acetyltransferase domain-containing protein [Gloeomargarita sp. SKYG116]MCS7293550.1 heparan-alpha-glucosaminide N-acetyltransferase domain-containing protein [Gloeomargarita sp. SKYB120]MDW8179116.1 heparan-alpha-glucosaminide N-acetyltransferase domain-containing protein [Gloeomargarita sp. SKYBB_i_bin120]MDW8401214.1 heparan-alpha-glucosaminide N-acetyltransferase domain-containing protein [Gloeomargarita sp. SKYGB_i_bin116]
MTKRWVSLDVFRGMTMAAMVLVNNPGDWNYVLPPLRHAAWHGCTPTDCIFPFFLFIMGVAIPLTRRLTPQRILRRTGILIGLGLLLNGFPTYDWSRLRLLGVLQRIGLCYLGATVVYQWTPTWQRRAIMVSLLVGHALLLTAVPVPGGGIDPLTPTGNWGAWLDRQIFSPQHLYPLAPFFGQGDPESLLGTLPALVTVLLGLEAGLWLQRGGSTSSLALGGLSLLVLGYGWGTVLPWNKPLWTGSYVLWTGGWACLILAGLYAWVEERGRQGWCWPWVVLGRNALVLFVGAGLLGRSLRFYRVGETPLVTWLFEQAFLPWLGPWWGSLGFALAMVALWWVALYGLDRWGIWLRV